MEKVIIDANFHIFVSQGEGKPEAKALFTKGMVVAADEIPEGHTAESWVEKGLAKAA